MKRLLSMHPARTAGRWDRRSVWIVAGMTLVLWCGMATGQEREPSRLELTDRGVWEYAETLFRGREYYRAISEYKRLLHYFPGSGLSLAARVRIGEALLNGGEPAGSIGHFSGLLDSGAMAPYRPPLLYLRGLGHLENERHLPYAMREGHIALALADLRASLDAAREEWPLRPRVGGFVSAMETPPDDLPSKSPLLAGTLSALLPGAGSAYVGRWSEAALSFFINALFIGATANAARKDNDDLAVVLGVGALAFYAGNIYAAVNGAYKYNDRVQADYLERQRVRFGILPTRQGLSGILIRRF